jgi:hypothetical protein
MSHQDRGAEGSLLSMHYRRDCRIVCVLGCIGEWLITDLAIGVSVEKAIGTLYKFVLQCFPYSTRTAAACYDARLHLLLYTLPLPVVEPEHKIFRRLW